MLHGQYGLFLECIWDKVDWMTGTKSLFPKLWLFLLV